jgi:fibronectin-binding autotransporter adhesin
MKNKFILILILQLGIFALNAQVKIGNNPNSINVNSLLEMENTNKGFLASLLEFKAAKNGKYVDVNWITKTEADSKFYTIEKSKDAIHYQVVSSVNGAGNSKSVQTYSVTDIQPYEGISYYRLKETNLNGQEKYYGIVSVNFQNQSETGFDVFPNPNNGLNIGLSLLSEKDEELELIIKDALGKICYSDVFHALEKGVHTITVSPSQKLPQGIYYISAGSAQKNYIKKLVVN